MVYEFDHTKVKNLTEYDIERIDEMRANIPRIEEILKEYGVLVKGGIDMWYTGFSWFVHLRGKPVIVMTIEYSDGRFALTAYRFCSTKAANDRTKYPTGYPTAQDAIRYSDDFHRYLVSSFTDWITMDRLSDTLGSFVQFIRPRQYSCDVEETEG
jgi:hypothetical protein